jgi:hypothetical protein
MDFYLRKIENVDSNNFYISDEGRYSDNDDDYSSDDSGPPALVYRRNISYRISKHDIALVKNQCPNATDARITQVLINNNGDVVDTVLEIGW